MNNYTRILTYHGAWQFSLAGLLARFPMSMVGISTILAVQVAYGSYSAAGTVSAANIIAAAIGAPLLSRAADRRGQAAAMMPAVIISGAGLAGLIIATGMHAPLWILIALAAINGGFGGSMGSLVRSRWSNLLRGPGEIHTAFSLEAALDEVAFMIGPVLATALCTSSVLPATSGWMVALALQLGGGMWFLLQRGSEPPVIQAGARARGGAGAEAAGGTATAERHKPVLARGAVLSVILVFTCSGMMWGANDVSAVAMATELGQKSHSGIILACWATGSFLAALVYGARAWSWPLWKQFALGTVWMALGASLFLVAPNLLFLGAFYMLAGLGTAPTITAGNNIIQATVPASQLTEGLAWVGTSMNIGVSLGSMIGGHAIDAGGSRGGYLLTAGAAWLGVALLVATVNHVRHARAQHTEITGDGTETAGASAAEARADAGE